MKQGRDAVQTECIRIAEACLAAGKNYGDVTLKYKVSYQQIQNGTFRLGKWGRQGQRTGAGSGKNSDTENRTRKVEKW